MRRYLQFVADNYPLLSFGFISIFWGNFGQSFFISWYGAPIQASLGIGATTYGSIYSAATLASGVAIMVVGGAIDRWPLRRFVVMVSAGLTVAALVLWQTSSVWMLLLGFFLVRLCGQGLLPHTAQTTMARQFELSRGKALSISASGVPVGEIVLPVMAVICITALGWRTSWLLVAVSVPFIYLPLALSLLSRAQRRGDFVPLDAAPLAAGPGKAKPAGRRAMLADRRFWFALPALIAGPFTVTAIFIHQNFILQQKDWSAAWFASSFIAYGLVHWLSSLCVGVLVDRFTAQRLLPLMVVPLAAAVLFAANVEGQWIALAMMSLMGVTIGASGPIGGALWAEVYGTEKLGSIRSLVSSIMILSTAASPVLLGLLIDAGQGAQKVLNVLGAALLVAVLMAAFSYRRLPSP